MTIPGLESEASGASAVLENATPEGDTPAGQPGHTPAAEPRTVDDLVAELEARKAEIPPERLVFLNDKMQQGFTRKMNLLHKSVEPVASKMLQDAGVELPAGKTVMDLLTEGDGKEFFRVWEAHQARQMQPVLEHINQQKMTQQLQEWANFAQREFPVVRDNYQAAVQIVAGNEDLAEMARRDEWRQLPYVLQGAAYKVAYDKLMAENTELKKAIDAARVATKAKTETSLAGGPVAQGRAPVAGNGADALEKAISAAFQKVAEGAV